MVHVVFVTFVTLQQSEHQASEHLWPVGLPWRTSIVRQCMNNLINCCEDRKVRNMQNLRLNSRLVR